MGEDMETRFKLVVPVYCAEKYIEKCLVSIINQRYQNYSCVIVDDASLDRTAEKINNIMKSLPDHIRNKFSLMKRTHNVGALENIIAGVNRLKCEPDDVILLIDGDDFLYSTEVLGYLNEVYKANPELLLTWGDYIQTSDNQRGVCGDIRVPIESYRKDVYGWCTSHLRTFKFRLYILIKDKDMRDENGKYYAMSWDLCLLFPMLEMAGKDRIKYLNKILYCYCNENALNDHVKDLRLQLAQAMEIRSKPPYKYVKEI